MKEANNLLSRLFNKLKFHLKRFAKRRTKSLFRHFTVEFAQTTGKVFFLTLQTPCSSYPCKNGGKCVPNYSDDQYQCDCSPGYGGDHCETGKL